ncbi:MAG: hypothetical protein HYZ15_07845 [Sphingobacteriales bacterium]|nr:hypothetical protein [Sphingobacteriales bacterium]
MNHPRLTILWKNGGKKLGIILLFACTGLGAFATLGDGNKKSERPGTSLLSGRTKAKPGSFSLKSGYNYRGNYVINSETGNRTIRLNTVVTVQKGRTTFIVPLKKNVVLNRVKLDIGNRQFQRN